MDVELLDNEVETGEQQPQVKRKLSRLHHMTVSKPAASPAKEELPHKSSACKEAGFGSAEKAARDQELEDADEQAGPRPAAAVAQTSGPLGDAALMEEAPAITPVKAAAAGSSPHQQADTASAGKAAEHPPSTATAAAGTAEKPATAADRPVAAPMRLRDEDLDDDDDDDEWEDQPFPMNNPAESASTGGGEASEAAGAQAAAGDSQAAAEYDPSNRRRVMYDDEDEWEQLVLKEKQGTQNAAVGEGEKQEKQGSYSGSGSGDDDDEGDILADDPDDTNAATQRLLRESARDEGLGKGFKPQVAPLNSILGKLAARQAALEAKARQQRAPAAATDYNPQPAMTFEQLKAHLAQHSFGNKQKPQQTAQQAAAADGAEAAPAAAGDSDRQEPEGAAPAAAGPGGDAAAADVELDCIDVDDDFDDLVVEPPQQQQQQQQGSNPAGAGMLLPETQQMLDDLPLAAGAGVVGGTEVLAGTAAELDLQLDEDAEDGSDKHDSKAAAASGSEEEADGSGSEEEVEEEQSSEPVAEPEPLHWEEEEEELVVGASSQQQQQQQEGEAAGQQQDPAAAAAAAGVKKKAPKLRREVAAGGFIEAEADLSDDEGRVDDGDSDDEDDADDAELAELIAEVKEGRMDEARRAALHARWLDGQEARDVKDLLEALRRGFRRKRRAAAGLDDDDDDGTDAAARRRRAQLLGTLDAEEEEEDAAAGATDRMQRLDFQWKEEEGDAEALAAAAAAELENRDKQKKIQRLQLQASESQQESDVIQLLQMDVDEDSQHTAALLSRSASVATTAPQGPTRSAAIGLSNLGPGNNLRQQQQQHAAAAGGAAAAAADHKQGTGAGGFSFQMFGKDLTNSKPPQVAGSFIGRQASSSVTVRAASNYGASRSFVFGSDPSNYSNPGAPAQQQQQEEGKAVGPSSFAGLSTLIAEAAPKPKSAAGAAGKQLSGRGSEGSSLLHLLHERKGSGAAAAAAHGILKQQADAVGAKFKAAGSKSRGGAQDSRDADATSREPWQF